MPRSRPTSKTIQTDKKFCERCVNIEREVKSVCWAIPPPLARRKAIRVCGTCAGLLEKNWSYRILRVAKRA
jgi:hypothetical protein